MPCGPAGTECPERPGGRLPGFVWGKTTLEKSEQGQAVINRLSMSLCRMAPHGQL